MARVQLGVRGVLVLGVNLACAQRTVVLALKQNGPSVSDPGTGLTDREASDEAVIKPPLPGIAQTQQQGHSGRHLPGTHTSLVCGKPFCTSPE